MKCLPVLCYRPLRHSCLCSPSCYLQALNSQAVSVATMVQKLTDIEQQIKKTSGKQVSSLQHCTAASRLLLSTESTAVGWGPIKMQAAAALACHSLNCFCNNQDLCLQVASAASTDVTN